MESKRNAPSISAADDEAQEAAVYCCRSLVGIAGLREPLDEVADGRAPASCFFMSGFVMESREQWVWVTAGHVIRELEQSVARGEAEYGRFIFADNYGPNAIWHDGFPFADFWGARKLIHYDKADKGGLDFALVELRFLEREALKRNGVVPVTERDWKGVSLAGMLGFAMAGVPNEAVDRNKTILPTHYVVHGKAFPNVLHVEWQPNYPAAEGGQQAVFRIGENCDEINIAGMSGGPILGIPSGPEEIKVVAIQSAWLSGPRIIFATPLHVVGPIAAEWMKDLD